MRTATLLTLMLAVTGCGSVPPPAAPQLDTPIATELPNVAWSPIGEAQTYDPANLWDAINGAADGYLAYGFVRLTIQEYASEGIVASVEVYDQGTPLNAFGVYRRDRPPESTPIGAGAEALISSPHHCAMLAGAKYVQARALDGELDDAGCRGLFRGLLRSMPGSHDLPPELDLLPLGDRITGSEGFTKESYLGVTELKDCLHAEYRSKNDATYKLFAFIESKERDATAIWSDLETKWAPARDGNNQTLHRSVPYTGEVVAVRTEHGLFGVAGAGDLDTSLTLLERVVGD
ncbi:MAG: hypothetical protein JRF63_08030 [Deltaproteobacteria bacterium]|nr:hypothetical protein [Deltaproteobacteria bacterium]